MAEQIETTAALSRQMGVSRKSAFGWIKRPDWPFSRRPPWPTSLLPEIQSWRGIFLRENRGADDDDDDASDFIFASSAADARRLRSQADQCDALLEQLGRGELSDADFEQQWAKVFAKPPAEPKGAKK